MSKTYTVGELIEELVDYRLEQKVLALDGNDEYPIYKTESDAEDTEVFLYLGKRVS